VPVDAQLQSNIAATSQKEVGFAPTNMMADDLGSRSKIRNAKSLVWYPAEIDVSIRPGWFYHPSEDKRVKSPATLMDIYFSSVGRNGVLLLNIPPDTRGLIHDADIKNLQEWKRLKDATFTVNYLKGAKVVSSNGKKGNAMLDDSNKTHWTTKGNDTTALIEFQLKAAHSFDAMLLQENIRVGQRIEKFIVEYKEGDDWKKLTEGTTVGYKRLLRFPAVTSQAIRIRILSSRLNPTLAEVGLYRQAK
jgi:alpha-L-fucosidase